MIRPGEPIGPTTYHKPYMAVIFDLDGTLISSALDFHAMRKAVIELAQRSGVPPGELHTTESVPQLIEHAKTKLHAMTGADHLGMRFEGETNRKLDEIEMSALPTAKPTPGAKEALKSLSQDGYRLGVLTRSCEGFARTALHNVGVLPLFMKIRTRNDSGPAKPHPESLLLLLKDMNVTKDRALYVGDGSQDMECARAAGVDFTALVHPGEKAQVHEEELRRLGSFHVVHTFAELHRQVTGRA
ncbi:MAG: HAD family hydrolase [Euryarchaeota archaeon]|nr:HAD family hydrolase [Euryarchaeota archaeon]MDE1836734.1 HAD family hydrolase [Euryarchaeota archaeon]MDE1879752.1 HAD family hydrolase [Euryarchaeota archaeon]MDE2044718.1 HAD family hydrolase [Thermoplasmata archaeon]